MVVYLDILLFINAIVNYAILMTTEFLMKRHCRLYRIIAGACVGALFSLMIFIDSDNRFFLFLLRVLSVLSVSLITFGWKSRREFFRILLCNTAVSIVYCGFFILFYQLFKPPNMLIVNDVVYLQINPLWLTALTALIYIMVLALYKLFSERIKSSVVSLCFTAGQQTCTCVAKIDTGCNLKEPFSSSPVIIADQSVFAIDKNSAARIIPYTVLNGSSFLYAVKAEDVTIDKRHIEKDVYIASAQLHNPHYQALINPEILR